MWRRILPSSTSRCSIRRRAPIEDGGVLANRRGAPRAGRRRACRCAGQPRGVRMPDGTVTWPDAVTLPDITRTASSAGSSFLTWIIDCKSRRAIPHQMEQCG
jgi:hypothetical protein